MKKIFILILMMVCTNIFAQNEKLISFDDFKTWMNAVSFDGHLYQKEETVIDGKSFVAYFANTKDQSVIQIQASDVSSDFERLAGNTAKIYQYKGYKTALNNASGMATAISLEVKSLNLWFTIGVMGSKNQAYMESLVDKSKILTIKPSKMENNIQWPQEINTDERLLVDIKSIKKETASTEGYKYEYHVEVIKNAKLLPAIDKIVAQFGGDLTLVNMANKDFICASTDSYEALKAMKEGELIKFIYYIK